jgi:hypothetical protein
MAEQHPIAPLPDFNIPDLLLVNVPDLSLRRRHGGTTEVAANINAVVHTIAPMSASVDGLPGL